ncbi:MAG: rod shape-determining protein MreC [Candidatus Eisenbacteria bacterium]|nr:rod shape-determining protein MreC [Candidatus Eisenbacteria bacterium]
MIGSGRPPGGRALATCALISVILLVAGDGIQSRAASLLATTTLRPFQVALTLGPRLGFSWLENRGLHRRLEEQAWNRIRLQQLQAENRRLRALLDMTRTSPESLMVASILAREATLLGEVLHVDKGRSDGLREGAPVLSRGRLVGMVDQVEFARSRVLTLWNRRLRVSVRVGRPGPGGLLRWESDPGTRLRLEGIALEENVAPGDTVWTSGLGEVFPPGIPVGRVTAVEADSLKLLQAIRVRPLVSLARLQDVLVLVPPEDEEGR